MTVEMYLVKLKSVNGKMNKTIGMNRGAVYPLPVLCAGKS